MQIDASNKPYHKVRAYPLHDGGLIHVSTIDSLCMRGLLSLDDENATIVIVIITNKALQ